MKDFSATIKYLATLAHLNLEPEEKKRLEGQLSAILDAASKVQELNTDGVEPTSHVISLPEVFREDEIMPSLPVEEVLKNAPKYKEQYLDVPRMQREPDPDKGS